MKKTILVLLLSFGISYVSHSQSPEHKFEDYKVEVYTGKLADPDFSTNPGAKTFKTRIINSCKDGINFAGHYTVIVWGCGTACQGSMIVDRKTGRIFSGVTSSLGVEFKKDSRLFIMNYDGLDYTKEELEDCSYCRPEYYLLEKGELVEMK